MKLSKILPVKISKKISPYLLIMVILTLLGGYFYLSQNRVIEKTLQEQEANRSVEAVKDLTGKLKKGKDKNQPITEMVVIAQQRQDELINLAKDSPRDFLAQATLTDQAQNYPVEVQPYLEKEVLVKGSLQVVHLDDFAKKRSSFEFVLEEGGTKLNPQNRYLLSFVRFPPQDLPTGTQVQIKGVSVGQRVVAETGNSSGARYRLTVVAPGGGQQDVQDQKTAVLMINFRSSGSSPVNRLPVSQSQLKELLFKGSNSVNRYYQENSLGRVSFSGDVFGIYSIDGGTFCDIWNWSDQANLAAVSAGVNLDRYDRLVYVFEGSLGCGYGGIGTIGGDFDGFSKSWIFAYQDDVRIYQHELGHNLGVHHANSFNCGDRSIDYYSTCGEYEYGEEYDVMGNFWPVSPNSFLFNAPHKISLGWIPQSSVAVFNPKNIRSIYQLSPIGSTSGSIKAIKIPKPDTDEYYYVSYRQRSGFDSNLPENIVRGVNIHIWNEVGGRQTRVLDPTPGNGFSDVGLADGGTFYDSINKITIKQTKHDAAMAEVEVIYAQKPSDLIKTWQAGPNLPKALYYHASVIAGNSVYVVGGMNSSWGAESKVYRSRIGSDGLMSVWFEVSELPQALFDHQAMVAEGYILVAGGLNGSYELSPNVYSAKINNDGSLGNWNLISTLPAVGYDNAIVFDKGYLFAIRGLGSFSARVNSDGTLGEWREVSNLPKAFVYSQAMSSRGQIYFSGSSFAISNDFFRGPVMTENFVAKVNDDGTLGNWTSVKPPLPEGLMFHKMISANGYIFSLGGFNNLFDLSRRDYLSKTSDSATLSSWLIDNPLPLRLMNQALAVDSQWLVITGGYGGVSGVEAARPFYMDIIQDKVFIAKLPASVLQQPPTGYLDNVTRDGSIEGWAYDPDEPQKEVEVEFYLDLPYEAGSNRQADFRGVTGYLRSDVNDFFYISGNHGYDVVIPPQFLAGENRLVYIYAIDTQTGSKQLIDGPRGIKDIRYAPVGKFESVTPDGFLTGWVYDPDETGKTLEVVFYIDAPYESLAGSVAIRGRADILREDVNRDFKIQGTHGFRVAIPAQYRNGISHEVFAYAVDDKGQTQHRIAAGFSKVFKLNGSVSQPINVSAPIPGVRGIDNNQSLLRIILDKITSFFSR